SSLSVGDVFNPVRLRVCRGVPLVLNGLWLFVSSNVIRKHFTPNLDRERRAQARASRFHFLPAEFRTANARVFVASPEYRATHGRFRKRQRFEHESDCIAEVCCRCHFSNGGRSTARTETAQPGL